MDKFISTANGGIPIVLDDLRFMSQAVRDAFTGLMSYFGIETTDAFIISGVNPIFGGAFPGHWSYSDGWVCIEGEICKVDAAVLGSTLPTLGSPYSTDYHWEVFSDYDSNGTKIDEDGNQSDTYQLRKARVVLSQVPTGNYSKPDIPTISELIQKKVLPVGMAMLYNGSASTYFDSTGLALPHKGLDGYAIANGNNGTVDLSGETTPSGFYYIQKI